jgi:hypothetical protein
MRVVDRELAKSVAGFFSTTRANARLLALTKAGYLKRSFVGTIAGGRKAVYRLSAGAMGQVSKGSRAPKTAPKNWYSELFLEHQLKVNEVYVSVKHRAMPLPSCQFNRWLSFDRPLSKSLPIIPDGYFEIRRDSVVRPVFLEVDLGTEALRIWQKKVETYLRLAVSGEFSRIFGHSQFKVAVIANSERRAESIRKVAAKHTDKIFRFTSFEIINRESLWSAIWQRPVGDQRESLL